MKPWTEQQLRAIRGRGKGMLVSAAAGSGKTAVLAERCADLVCDPKHPCNVDELLVVTFTESAAGQMKSRIREALQLRSQDNPSNRLKHQLALVEHASVSTLHSFCARLIRQNYNRVELDPDFRILDEDESVLLQAEVAEDLFERRYNTDETCDFQRLIDAYGDGRDQRLIEKIIRTHGLLCSLADPQKWIDRTKLVMAQVATGDLPASELGRQLATEIDHQITSLIQQSHAAIRTINQMRGHPFAKYVDLFNDFTAMFQNWTNILRDHGFDLMRGEARDNIDPLEKAPPIKSATPGKELVQGFFNSIRDGMRKGYFSQLIACSSQQWQDGMRAVAPHAQVFLDLVTEFGTEFTRSKAADRAVDFSDLEHLALRILRIGDGISLPQFRHVLVDEYQDINEIQDEILRLVSHEGALRPGTLFCVGDVKQSIFRFRLAEPKRFLDRRDRFKSDPSSGEIVDLRENFRSRAPLLAAINAVFERLMTSTETEINYDDSHRLRPGKKFPAISGLNVFTGAPIELHLLPREKSESDESEDLEELDREEYEAIFVAKRILEMMGKSSSPHMSVIGPDDQPAPARFSDIVILLRSMKNKADAFADILRGHGIPVFSESGTGFFQATEVRDIICLLEILDNQQQDIPLAAILRSPLARIPNPDDALANIRLAYPNEKDQIPFHQAVRKYASEKTDALSGHLRAFLAQIADWRDQANKRPVAEVIWKIYEQSGYLAYVAGLDDGPQRAANLIQLHERAGQFGSFLRQGLYRFLKFLQNLREQKDVARPSLATSGQDAVRIMSIHRSKGLEFPIVFLPDLGKRHNLSDAHGMILADRAAGLGMEVVDETRMIHYPSLASLLVANRIRKQTMAEELRLLYVGLTRAKEHVVLVGTASDNQRADWTQWRNFSGPLPPDEVLSAGSALDWLGPVAEMTAAHAPPVLKIIEHPAADVSTWKSPRDIRPAFTPQQGRLAKLLPLEINPPGDEISRKAIAHFQWVYPFEQFTHQPSAASVTSLAKKPTTEETPTQPEGVQRKLDLPKFFLQESLPKPTDIGTATHLVLEHWDFSMDNDLPSIDRQIQSLVDRKLISPPQAKMVDRPSIHWMLTTEVGSLLAKHHATLMREIPFAVAVPASASFPSPGIPGEGQGGGPLDALMVRGRIDLLVPTPDGLAIVDYKTDNVTPDQLAERSQSYKQQMQWYRDALEKIAKAKITGIYLVFLKPREIMKL